MCESSKSAWLGPIGIGLGFFLFLVLMGWFQQQQEITDTIVSGTVTAKERIPASSVTSLNVVFLANGMVVPQTSNTPEQFILNVHGTNPRGQTHDWNIAVTESKFESTNIGDRWSSIAITKARHHD